MEQALSISCVLLHPVVPLAAAPGATTHWQKTSCALV